MYEILQAPLIKATWETIYMVFISGFISIFFGLLLGSFIFITAKKQSLESNIVQRALSAIVNVTRSIPFIILMISIIPLTRLLVGTTIGTNAAIVPLTIAAIPFFARVCENALSEVPNGLIEAAHAMGANTSQILFKVLLPEALPGLIRGATLTLIGLIGYSAMAGVVGGGGLGELAINYGYQRFNVAVMLETVLILIIMVQLIQMAGDTLAKKRELKSAFWCVLVLAIACLAYQFSPNAAPTSEDTIRVGVMSGWPEQVMQAAQQVAKKDYGINLQIVTFTDYVQPNTALNNDSIDANIFQHGPYLDAQVKALHYRLAVVGKTFVYPMGFYSQKIAKISALRNHALIAIANDPSNGGRALLILEKNHLIKLKAGVGTLATVNDIVSNPHHYQFKLLDAAQLPRVLKDADLVAINNDFIGPAGLSANQAILKESSDSPYANLIVVRADEKNKLLLQKLVAIMHSQAVLDVTQKIFPNGAAVPAW